MTATTAETTETEIDAVPEGMYLYGYHAGFKHNVYLCLPRTHKWQPATIIDGKVFVKHCAACQLDAEKFRGKWRYFLSGVRIW